jgi:hypothetical protein
LISDANGILVFLKFLTDKFEHLEPLSEEFGEVERERIGDTECKTGSSSIPESYTLRFKDEVMLTVYSVLLVLYGACNNYA